MKHKLRNDQELHFNIMDVDNIILKTDKTLLLLIKAFVQDMSQNVNVYLK